MRIAFFGGTFDPPHSGHLAIAEAALSRLRLDRILFAPVGRQPLKRDETASTFTDRCRMVELAIAGQPAFELSLLDAPRSNHQPNYTIDTILQLKSTLAPDDHLFCLTGADSFLTLRQWHRAADLLLACTLIVASRPGFPLGNLVHALPAGFKAAPAQPEIHDNYQTLHIENAAHRHAIIHILPNLDYEVSATQIRAELAAEFQTTTLLAPSVAAYIKLHNLYKSDGARRAAKHE